MATTQVWLGTPPCASRNSDVYMGVIASAPAKVILFGGHFVVYGEPAIVMAIDKRDYAKVELRQNKRLYLRSVNLNLEGYFENGYFQVEQGDGKEAKLKFKPLKLVVEKVLEIYGEDVGLDVEVNSTVPVAAGLGSSAAVAAAVTAAVGALLEVKMSKESVFRISYEAEKIVHGTPSEVDPAVSTFGGTLLFQMDTGFRPLDVKADVPLVVGYTGVNRSTRVQVAKVRDVRNKYSRVIDHVMKAAREIVLMAIDALRDGDLETLGDLMFINHALLCGLGISDESLEWLINAARRAGALGAKLTGAGGSPFIVRKTDEGVKVEGI